MVKSTPNSGGAPQWGFGEMEMQAPPHTAATQGTGQPAAGWRVPVTACFPLQCGTVDQGLYANLTERSLPDAQRFILMHEVVQPVSAVPAFMEDSSRFSHVAVDVVQARDALVHTIYLATGRHPPTSGLPGRVLTARGAL